MEIHVLGKEKKGCNFKLGLVIGVWNMEYVNEGVEIVYDMGIWEVEIWISEKKGGVMSEMWI